MTAGDERRVIAETIRMDGAVLGTKCSLLAARDAVMVAARLGDGNMVRGALHWAFNSWRRGVGMIWSEKLSMAVDPW